MFTSAYIAAKIHAIESDKKTPWVIVLNDHIIEVAESRAAARDTGIKGKISKYDASLVEFEEASETDVSTDANAVLIDDFEGDPSAEEVAASNVNEVTATAPVDTVAPTTPAPKLDVLRQSTIERPTKAVWHIAEAMLAADPHAKRKDIIAACVAKGIAFYTARTQYQTYFETLREQRTREAAADMAKA